MYPSATSEPSHPNSFKKNHPLHALLSWGSAPLFLSKIKNIAEFKNAPPIITYPGLGASDLSMSLLRTTLEKKQAQCYGWNQGFNKGLHEVVFQKALDQLEQVYKTHQRSVYLLGWSLGGIFARELAKTFLDKYPQSIAGVITLGSPINTMPTGGWILQLYQLLSRTPADEQQFWDRKLYMAPTCPTVSIYSKSDTIVPWASSIQLQAFAKDFKNIPISAGHIGMVKHPEVLYHLLQTITHIEQRRPLLDMEERRFQKTIEIQDLQKFMLHTLTTLNHPESSYLTKNYL